MLSSHFESFIKIDKNNFSMTLFDKGNSRHYQKKGRVGFLVLEIVNEKNEHACYLLGFPFGSERDVEITKLSLDSNEERTALRHSPNGTTMQSWVIENTNVIDKDEMGQIFKLINNNPNQGMSAPTCIPDYSLKKCIRLLDNMGIKGGSTLDPTMFPPSPMIEALLSNENTKTQPIKWNPFARLIENKQFKFSRIIRSSIGTRISDIFYLFNGSLGLENELGILDYVFPFPRLLINSLTFKLPIFIKVLIAIPTAILWSLKTIAAALITVPCAIVATALHPIFKIINSFENKAHKLQLKVIKGELESITDLNEKSDLEKEATLSSYAAVANHLVLKPIFKDTQNHYHEITKTMPYKNDETLMIGIFEKKDIEIPLAIAEITPKNASSIFAAIKINFGHIDENMEEANVMKEVLDRVKPK